MSNKLLLQNSMSVQTKNNVYYKKQQARKRMSECFLSAKKKKFPKALKLGVTGLTQSAPALFTDSDLLITHTPPRSILQGLNIVLEINKSN